MTNSRLTALGGVIALGVIGAVIYLITATSTPQSPTTASPTTAPPATTSPAPGEDPSPTHDQTQPDDQGPGDAPDGAASGTGHIWTGHYLPLAPGESIGGDTVPELDDDEQALVDPACTFIAALHTFDPDQVQDFMQIIDRLEPVTDPDLVTNIRQAVLADGPTDDFRLWVHERARVWVRCAGTSVTYYPLEVTTAGGHQVEAWPIETRIQLHLEPAHGPAETHEIAHLVHVARVPGTDHPVVIASMEGSGHGVEVDPTDLEPHHH